MADINVGESQVEAFSFIEELAKEREVLIKTRQSNLPRNIPLKRSEFQKSGKSQLKSDVKKSSAFVKKIRSINTEGIQQCIRDTETLNLALYISEIVSAIQAVSFKATDVSLMVKLCLSFHQKYEEFTEPLISGLKASMVGPNGTGAVEDLNDPEVGKKKRVSIRFLIELYQVGMFNDDDFFVQLLKILLGKVKPSQPNAKATADLQGLTVFVKCGSETLLGFLPKKVIDMGNKAGKRVEELPVKLLVSGKNATEMRVLISETYEKLCELLLKSHKDFRQRESKYEKDKLIHGTISDVKQQEYDNAKRLYERYLSVVTALSEGMNEKMPELVIEKEEEETSTGITVWDSSGLNPNANDPNSISGGPYGDPETRSFYEDLPDLLSIVPLAVLGFTPEQAAVMREEWAAKEDANKNQTDANSLKPDEINVVQPDEGGDLDVLDDDTDPSGNISANADGSISTAGSEENSEESRANKLTILLEEKLLECVNKQKVDDFCVQFTAFASNKAARKRLVQALIRLPRSRSELAPMYARILASLSRVYPDLLPPVLEAQRKEFYGILKTKKQLHVESKLRNVRYQGEMIKFNLAPPIVALRIFKTLLMESFSSSTIEMLTTLLESCGRYLYLLPHTQESMNQILEMMLRLRRAKNLDLFQQTLLESAYFAVKPPDRSRLGGKDGKDHKKELTVVQKYARYLIQQRLEDTSSNRSEINSDINVDDVIRSLRRLPWHSIEERVSYHVMKAVLKVARTKYISIPNLADCLSGLQRYYPNVVIEVVDRILEEIQRALENPFKRDHQRIHGFARLLGELYNFTALSTTVIFDILYHLINFGHDISRVYGASGSNSASASTMNPALLAANAVLTSAPAYQLAAINPIYYDPRVFNEVDLPTDLFRAQIICEILSTCGMYYVRGSTKEKLGRYLVYFQRYLLTKQFVPMHVEFTILDTFDNLEELARDATAEGIATATAKAAKKRDKFPTPIPVAPAVEFPRYDNIEAVQKVIDVLEGKDSKLSQRTGLDRITEEEEDEEDEGIANSNPNPINKNAESDDEDDGDDDSDEDGQGDSDSESDTDDGDQSDDDSDDDSEDDDEDGSDSDDDDDEEDGDDDQKDDDDQSSLENDDLSESEAAKMLEKLRIAEEDDEFERAFKNVVQESVSSVTTKHQDVNKMVIPAILPKPKNTFRMDDEDDGGSEKPRSTMTFKLLSRDNKGRLEARQLLVPQDNPMAQKVMKAEEELRLEKQRLKERVLQINQLTADDEYDEADAAAIEATSRYYGGREPTAPTVSQSRSAKFTSSHQSSRGSGKLVPAIRAEETRKAADTLNLDEFLAESSAMEMRRMGRK